MIVKLLRGIMATILFFIQGAISFLCMARSYSELDFVHFLSGARYRDRESSLIYRDKSENVDIRLETASLS